MNSGMDNECNQSHMISLQVNPKSYKFCFANTYQYKFMLSCVVKKIGNDCERGYHLTYQFKSIFMGKKLPLRKILIHYVLATE